MVWKVAWAKLLSGTGSTKKRRNSYEPVWDGKNHTTESERQKIKKPGEEAWNYGSRPIFSHFQIIKIRGSAGFYVVQKRHLTIFDGQKLRTGRLGAPLFLPNLPDRIYCNFGAPVSCLFYVQLFRNADRRLVTVLKLRNVWSGWLLPLTQARSTCDRRAVAITGRARLCTRMPD